MASSKISRYWGLQIGGWLVCAVIPLLFAREYNYFSNVLVVKMLFLAALGIGLTHILRYIFRLNNWMRMPIDRVWIVLLCAVLVTAVVQNTLLLGIIYLFDLSKDGNPVPFFKRAILASLDTLPILMVWVMIYYVWHFVEYNRNQQLESLRLESLVKELELKTIKSHINPHFIFNALNSIRALVDENPLRARTAITELSNILRSSMQTEKTETVPLEKELAIVKDYLALEKIRFEERLRVELDIDEETLEEPVPIMMLQTLVENAIKHGISKRMEGGVIRVRSYFRGNHHVLVVQNTGHLNGKGHDREEGFGLMSTQSRLSILYGTKANFEIKDLNTDTVEARISIPVESI